MNDEAPFDEAKPAGSQSLAQSLTSVLAGYGRAAVALSGGVDSTVVAKAARIALGEQAVAITACSPSVGAREVESARRLAERIGIRHLVVDTKEFENPRYVQNDGTRCYHCKSELYDRFADLAELADYGVICSGANLDDLGDYRPGLQAAAERGVRHPLQEAGMTKSMVRQLARYWDLPNWDKPASPCLSSRIAVGVEATPERVRRVEAAEEYLRSLGIGELRVRVHPGEHARIEIPLDFLPRLIAEDVRRPLVERFEALGFGFVSLDLKGFRSGSLNSLVPSEMLIASANRSASSSPSRPPTDP